jgi:starch-binding outer membrane protein, SusD/RagB family
MRPYFLIHSRHRAFASVWTLPLALLLSACSLEVSSPDIVRPEQLAGPAALPTLLAGATGDFAVAFAGDPGIDEGIILAGGLRADEFLNRDTFIERRDMDLGTMRDDNGSLRDLYRNINRARRSAEFTAARFDAAEPDAAGHAEALSLAGFLYVALGENFCSGLTVSDLSETGTDWVPGGPITTDSVFRRALGRFSDALAVATVAGNAQQMNLAHVGRGRALLNLARTPADFTAAATAVAAVPSTFVYNIEFSENTARENNAVFTFNNVNRRWGVADREGGNGMAFVTAGDPRVPTEVTTRNGLDGVPPRIVNQLKYPSRSASIRLADGREARLIEAEAALHAGNTGTFLSIHNTLRAGVPGLAPLTDPGTPQTREDLHFRERAFWMFATGHRLGDMRRLLKPPYSRAFNTVYPVGTYFKFGLPYGTEANLIVHREEENNPNFQGCTTRAE